MTEKDENIKKVFKALEEAGKDIGFEVMTGQKALDFVQKEMNKPENVKARAENAKKQKSNLEEFFSHDHKYKWEPGMGEISGFGGSYEQGCRAMVIAGLEFWDHYPDLNPQFKGWEGVFGILQENNDDAKKLEKVVLDVVDHDCTGAMHMASIQTILYIRKHGWDKYVEEMKKSK